MHKLIYVGLLLTALCIFNVSCAYVDEIKSHEYKTPLNLDDSDVEQVKKDILSKSEKYRAKYNLSKFMDDQNLNYYAQDWANRMADENFFGVRKDKDRKYGEIVFMSSELIHLGEVIVDLWYRELSFIEKVENTEAELLENIKHTKDLYQLLWSNTTHIGVGVSRNNSGEYYVCVEFFRPGNIEGKYLEYLPTFIESEITDQSNLMREYMTEMQSKDYSLWSKFPNKKLPKWKSELYPEDNTN